MTTRRLGPPRLGPSAGRPASGAGAGAGAGGAGAGAGATATASAISVPRPVPPAGTHALKSEWTLWYMSKQGGGGRRLGPQSGGDAGWGGELREVFTFGTVEDFWRMHHNILKVVI